MNDAEQFEAIVNEHYEPLFRFAMSLAHAESDACDLTQQTFYVWAAKGYQLRDVSKVRTWLFTTLYRDFLKTRRRQARFSQPELEDVTDPDTLVDFTEPVEARDWSKVRAALAEVDEIHRAAVALFYLEDCSYKEIAAILQVPMGTVKSRIARGIAQLKEILSRGGSSQPGDEWATPSEHRSRRREEADHWQSHALSPSLRRGLRQGVGL